MNVSYLKEFKTNRHGQPIKYFVIQNCNERREPRAAPVPAARCGHASARPPSESASDAPGPRLHEVSDEARRRDKSRGGRIGSIIAALSDVSNSKAHLCVSLTAAHLLKVKEAASFCPGLIQDASAVLFSSFFC